MSVLLDGLKGRKYYYDTVTVTLDVNGTGTKAITFPTGFITTPSVYLVPGLSDAGTYTASSITKTGCTIQVTTSDTKSQDLEVIFIAHEKS